MIIGIEIFLASDGIVAALGDEVADVAPEAAVSEGFGDGEGRMLLGALQVALQDEHFVAQQAEVAEDVGL